MRIHARHLIAMIVAAAALTGGGLAYAYGFASARELGDPIVAVGIVPVAPQTEVAVAEETAFGFPMDKARERVTKKPFGLEIEPGHSPVPGDRFSGFHVGVDFETFEDEADVDVPVRAICDGPLLLKTWAKGYGGVAIQRCRLDGADVSVIYGHLRIGSVSGEVGASLARGQAVGVLGTGHSTETDGVRKHLHLGVRNGIIAPDADGKTDIRGYVKEDTELPLYLDPLGHMSTTSQTH